ncbi:MAG TPA: MBL fold metallo-hydrolase [Polyangia bacterium]|nr:MBL fold metallo-hydrolase [Polyangia bacterium]
MLRRLARWFGLATGGLVALALAGVGLAWLSTNHFAAFGGSPDPARLRASPEFVSGRFENPEPTSLMAGRKWVWALREWLFGEEMRAPLCPLPVVTDTAARLAAPPASGLRVTWLGHSTTLVEIDGATVLTDPMWGERASPSRWIGPKRFAPPPLALAALPHLDAVVVSHEHYDHLDEMTVRALAARGVPFHVPLGIGAHLAAWGVPAAQIVEHDWWQDATLPGGVRLVSTPSRHFNGRGLPWRTGALWTSWSIVGPRHRVFFSGDTGPTESLREIARREGPFDVALIEIGQYNTAWGDIHLGPEGALDAFARSGAKVLIPIHWGTFVLAYHAWSEPPETLVTLAAKRGAAVLTPRLGEPVEPAATPLPATTAWWRAYPPIADKCP